MNQLEQKKIIQMYLKEGNEYKQQEMFDEALDKYENALLANPDSIPVLLQLAGVCEKKQNFDKAIFYYQKIVALSPEDKLTKAKLARAMLLNNNIGKSIVAYKEAIKMQDSLLWAYIGLGDALTQNEQLAEAYIFYKKAAELALDSTNDNLRSSVQIKLGQVARSLDKFKDAIAAYNKAIEIKPKQAKWVFMDLGDVLTKNKQDKQAILIYQKALELYPDHDQAYTKLGELLLFQGNLNDAISAYQSTLKIQPNQPPKVYLNLGNAFIQNNQENEAILLYESAIETKRANPNIDLYTNLADLYTKKEDLNSAIAIYKEVISLKQNLPFKIYRNLANILNRQGREQEAEKWLQVAQQVNYGEKYLNIWRTLNQISLDNLNNLNNLNKISSKKEFIREEVEQYFVQNSFYKVLQANSLQKDDKNFLKSIGFSLDYLKANRAQLIGDQKLPVSKKNFQDSVPRNPDLFYQLSVINEKKICAVCPVTGKTLYSQKSFPLWWNFYRFVGTEVFYLVSGRSFGQRCFLYFPKSELVFLLANSSFSNVEIKSIIDRWKSFMVAFWQEVKGYLTNRSNPKLAVIIQLNHLGHHFWNELTGLQQIIDNQLLEKVDQFLVTCPEFFGNIDKVFPEISSQKVQRTNDVNKVVLHNNYFAVRIADIFIKESLAKQVSKVAHNMCSKSYLETVKEARVNHFPLLWVTIRVGSREWIDQGESLPKIIKKLAEAFPKLAIVFDGISLVRAQDHLPINKQEKELIEKEKQLAQQIKEALPPEIQVYNTIGHLMQESVVWSQAVDLYLSPWGAGLTKVAWISNKPGVIHSNPVVTTKYRSNSYGGKRENVLEPIYTSCKQVTSSKSLDDLLDRRDQLGSYLCDWEAVYKAVYNLIRSIGR